MKKIIPFLLIPILFSCNHKTKQIEETSAPVQEIVDGNENITEINPDTKGNSETDEDQFTTENMQMIQIFKVKEIEEENVILEDLNGTGDLYTLNKSKLNEEDIEVGDEFQINWNGISTKSYPAQFGEIFKVKKVD